jgi:pimeloyl-ACP methyl ester carboxylesterase
MMARHVKSADGTSIAFETAGSGHPLVLVGGAFSDRKTRTAGTPLAALLASRFSVRSYDRRGRGASGDTAPYAIEREVEDLAALIEDAGGSAFVYGISSGALLALGATTRGVPIAKLALYEPPLMLEAARAKRSAEVALALDEATLDGRRADAVELFMTKVMQLPAPVFERVRRSPAFPGLEALAHTLRYDVRITAQGPSLFERAKSIRVPTLAVRGDTAQPWMSDAIDQLVAVIVGARLEVLAGQTHDVDPNVLAGVLEKFFGED